MADYSGLLNQVRQEYQIAWDHQKNDLDKNLGRLKLYNNQSRDKKLISEPVLYTIFQSVFSALYNDRLSVDFQGREEGDMDVAGNITNVAEYDYERMKKAMLDYYWIWDAMFSGRGIVEMFKWDRKDLCPKPIHVDAFSFLHDPEAISIHGLVDGNGEMTFGGYEVLLGKDQLSGMGVTNFDKLRSGTGINEYLSLSDSARLIRDQAFGFNATANNDTRGKDLGINSRYSGLKWFTRWDGASNKSKKICIITDISMSSVLWYKELDEWWPLIDRPISPVPRSWDCVSIPDLVEDKQRHKSAMMNIAMEGVKAELHPAWLYDKSAVKNKYDLVNVKANQFIPVKEGMVGNAVQRLERGISRVDLVNYIMSELDLQAQKATATPEIVQGVASQDSRTLGELNLISGKSGMRYSLTAKLFANSDATFWQIWYYNYKKYFRADLDEKVVRISGSWGKTWRTFTRENLIGYTDPDIFVESMEVSKAKKERELAMVKSIEPLVLSDPTANKRYYQRKMARLTGMDKSEVDKLFPPTPQELYAEEENKRINENENVPVNATDEHVVHLEILERASDTPAKWAHRQAHIEAQLIAQKQPELGMQQPQTAMTPDQQGQGVDIQLDNIINKPQSGGTSYGNR